MAYTRKKLKNPNNNINPNSSSGITRVFNDFINNEGDTEAQARILAKQQENLRKSTQEVKELERTKARILELEKQTERAVAQGNVEEAKKLELYKEDIKNIEAELSKKTQYQQKLEDSYKTLVSLASDETKEYSAQAAKVLEKADALEKEKQAHEERLEQLREEAKLIQASEGTRAEKAERLAKNQKEQRKEENSMRKALGQMSLEEEEIRQNSTASGILDLVGAFGGDEAVDGVIDAIGTVVPEVEALQTALHLTEAALNLLTGAIGTISKAMDAAVDGAAQFLDQNYTAINANLTGSSIDFEKIADKAVDELGMNRFLEQTDYLQTIRDMTDAGLTFNIEERAMLQAIKDKTLHTFDATEASLTRIIRLLQRDVTATQFGTEYALRNLLNSVFGDTSYLNNLYDSVQSAIIDASVATGKGDITPFNSTTQTWLAYMYEAGLSDSVVNKIAEGLNMLGSGNVQGLMNQADLQKLFLLSMDAIGLDYADILQQGLDAETTNNLMKSIIAYLNEIATNTQDNLVLQAAYGDLFNLSISDIKAIQNLANTNIQVVKDYSAAAAATTAALASISENTLFATQMDTLMNNLSYTFGSSVVENTASYATYKIADFIYDAFSGFTDMGGIAGKVATVGADIAGITKMLTALPGFIALLGSADTIFSSSAGTFTDFFDSGKTGVSYTIGSGENVSTAVYARSSINASRNNNFITTKAGSLEGSSYQDNMNLFRQMDDAGNYTEAMATTDDWADKDDTTQIEILRRLDKTFMTTEVEGKTNYAVAVSLEGMSNSVLKSFASIFADEDAMLATFQGDNTVITNALFNFTDDTSKDTRRVVIGTGNHQSKAEESGNKPPTVGI